MQCPYANTSFGLLPYYTSRVRGHVCIVRSHSSTEPTLAFYLRASCVRIDFVDALILHACASCVRIRRRSHSTRSPITRHTGLSSVVSTSVIVVNVSSRSVLSKCLAVNPSCHQPINHLQSFSPPVQRRPIVLLSLSRCRDQSPLSFSFSPSHRVSDFYISRPPVRSRSIHHAINQSISRGRTKRMGLRGPAPLRA
jgi:hypothetical protein